MKGGEIPSGSCSCTAILLPLLMGVGAMVGYRLYHFWGAVVGCVLAVPCMGLILAAVIPLALWYDRRNPPSP